MIGQAMAERLARAHPCYSEGARERHGRIHLPVAPACNLGCSYCERSIGPRAAGSGPGSARRVLSPDEAAERVVAVARRGWLRVVGIAGPGEPLANPQTLETLRRVRALHPELLLCLSTNGLRLAESLPELLDAGLSALTVTINTTREETASRIYAWAEIDGTRVVGPAAAAAVLLRQWRGLEAALDAGLLVKVNSVLIPGINDDDVVDVARRAAALGAHRHNIMPLLPRGRMRHRRAPTASELETAQARAGRWLRQFRSCTQCPADVIAPPLTEGGS